MRRLVSGERKLDRRYPCAQWSSSQSAPAPAALYPSVHKAVARWFTFPVAIGFLLFLAVFLNNLEKVIVEPDIWWHLQNAQQMVTTHSLTRIDHYSFTAAGSQWIDHEWLSELAYYGAFLALGLRGILAIYCVCSLVIFGVLYYMCCRAGANLSIADDASTRFGGDWRATLKPARMR